MGWFGLCSFVEDLSVRRDLNGYHYGLGRQLFAGFCANALGAEQGAITFVAPETARTAWSLHAAPMPDHFVFAEEGEV
jgi:phosphogluconate dehydratase